MIDRETMKLRDGLRDPAVKSQSSELVQGLAEPFVMLVVESDEPEAEFRVCLPLHSAADKFDQSNDWTNGGGNGNFCQHAAFYVRCQQSTAARHGESAERAFHQLVFHAKVSGFGVGEGRPWSAN